ncbi:MAG: GNAT family N-acetyltransferase [Terriglobales bacterium]
MITYCSDRRPASEAVIALYQAAPLHRPVDNPARIQQMFAQANLVWTAWDGERLVGVLRGWTDGAYHGYICDLAVDAAYHKAGIGRELLRRATEGAEEVEFILRAAATARDYYAHLGWQKVENGWCQPRTA